MSYPSTNKLMRKITWFLRRFRGQSFLEQFLKQFKNKRIIDIGTAENDNTYCIHSSNQLIRTDIRRVGKVDVVCSVEDMPFRDETFDVVLCLNVLEHVENPFKARDELIRITKKGGYVVVNLPLQFPLHDQPCDYWRFTNHGMKLMFKDLQLVSRYESVLIPRYFILGNMMVFKK